MRSARLPALLLVGALGAGAVPASADDEVTVRSDAASLPTQGARLLSLEVPVGEVHVVGTDGDQAEARLVVRCDRDSSRCRDRARNIRLRPERSGGELSIEVVGYPKSSHGRSPQADLELRLPRGVALRVEMGVGEVDVRGLEGDVDIELGVGEARVQVAESAVGEVALDVGVGEANLRPRPRETRSSRFLFLGNEIDWDGGSGRASISVEVGVGEADVELEP